jgi:ATP-dependent protease Clp ATPase subunit
MYEVPSRDDIAKVIITLDTVKNKTAPIYELKAPDADPKTEN